MDWQTLDWQSRTAVALIGCGAVILGFGIFALRRLFAAAPLIAERSRRYVLRSLRIHRILMIFFLIGYLLVAINVLAGGGTIGLLAVSLVFLSGAVFVLLGIALHARMIQEIQNTIQGLLPICMECKRIRLDGRDSGDQAAWKEIESYISQRTEARFSHGICPQCLDKVRRRRG